MNWELKQWDNEQYLRNVVVTSHKVAYKIVRAKFCVMVQLYIIGKRVTSEVRRIMGPAIPSTSYSSPMHSLTNFGIPRRSKQKGKYSAAACNKSNKKSVSFQKKLYVFDYMGENPPNKFTRCDKDIYISGMLPSLSTNSTEKEVREEICALIHSSSGSSSMSVKPTDFEFINMCGKQASVAYCKEGFHWDGRAVKELSGSGGVYVRLTKSTGTSTETSSSDEELPEGPLQRYLSSRSNQSHSNVDRLVTCSRSSCGEDVSHNGEVDNLHPFSVSDVAHDRTHENSDDSLLSQRDNSSHWLVSDAGNNSNFFH